MRTQAGEGRPQGVYGREDCKPGMALDCDVVIVGSGAGGATAAAELAEAGLDVIVLEEGGYHGPEGFNANVAEAVRRMYRDGGASMAVGASPVMFQEGRTVGGSSVINGGMSWRTPVRILDRWQSEHRVDGLNAAAMEPYFERVERRIHVAPQPEDTFSRDSLLVQQGADRLGWSYDHNLRNQLHCAGSNNCAWGCPTGAKQSTLVTYIPRALHFGARIYSNARVERVLRKGQRAIGVTGRVVRTDAGRGDRFTVRAKVVLVTCGSIQTTALLRRSRVTAGQLGRNLSMHPNVKLVAIFDEEVRAWEGGHQAHQIREHVPMGIVSMAAANVPPGILAMALPCHGAGLGELMQSYKRAVVAGILLEDTSTGRVRVTPRGEPIVTYSLAELDFERLRRGTRLACELLFEAGARRIVAPFEGFDDITGPDQLAALTDRPMGREAMELFTVHMMGTARMGRAEDGAVTDGFGRVHGAERLIVCDASLFPSPVGVNPCETIQALATRNAGHIIENRAAYFA